MADGKKRKITSNDENTNANQFTPQPSTSQQQDGEELFQDSHSSASSASALQMSRLEGKIESEMTRMATMIQDTVSSLADHMERQFSDIDRKIKELTTNKTVSESPINTMFSRTQTNQNNSTSNSELPNPITLSSQSKGDNSNFKMKPQIFSGSSDFDEFLSQFEITCEINNWQYKEKSLYLANCLSGEARSLLNELDYDGRRDYKILVDTLTNRFGSVNRSEIYRTQLKSRTRNKGETIPELAQAIRKLVRQAYPGVNKDVIETLSLDNFVDALTDSDIRLRVRELGPKSLAEAEQIAVRMEAHKIADKQRSRLVGRLDLNDKNSEKQSEEKQSRSDGQFDNLCDTISTLTNQVKNLTTESFQNAGQNPTFTNQHQAGAFYHGNRNTGQNQWYNGQYRNNQPNRPGYIQPRPAVQFRGNNSNHAPMNRNRNSSQGYPTQNRQNFANQGHGARNGPNFNGRYSNNQAENRNQSAWGATTRRQ